MSHWDGTQIVRWPPRRVEDKPNWIWVDCGCCGGIEWSAGTEPWECAWCAGGWYAVHIPTGTIAHYPGGPLSGPRMPRDEINEHVRYLDTQEALRPVERILNNLETT